MRRQTNTSKGGYFSLTHGLTTFDSLSPDQGVAVSHGRCWFISIEGSGICHVDIKGTVLCHLNRTEYDQERRMNAIEHHYRRLKQMPPTLMHYACFRCLFLGLWMKASRHSLIGLSSHEGKAQITYRHRESILAPMLKDTQYSGNRPSSMKLALDALKVLQLWALALFSTLLGSTPPEQANDEFAKLPIRIIRPDGSPLVDVMRHIR